MVLSACPRDSVRLTSPAPKAVNTEPVLEIFFSSMFFFRYKGSAKFRVSEEKTNIFVFLSVFLCGERCLVSLRKVAGFSEKGLTFLPERCHLSRTQRHGQSRQYKAL